MIELGKHELARIFNAIGTLLEVRGENPFKVRTYYQAARTLERLTEDLEKLIQEDRLKEIPGFGTALIGKTLEWKNTGTINYYEESPAPRRGIRTLTFPVSDQENSHLTSALSLPT